VEKVNHVFVCFSSLPGVSWWSGVFGVVPMGIRHLYGKTMEMMPVEDGLACIPIVAAMEFLKQCSHNLHTAHGSQFFFAHG
jgi:hypothetical protein